MEKFSFEKAQTEAAKMQKIIENNEVSTYAEAEETLEKKKKHEEQTLEENKKYTDDYLDYLFDRLDDVGLSEKRETIEDDLIDAIYDSKTRTIADVCKELELIIELRAEATEYLRAGISINEKDSNVKKGRLNLVRDIDQSINNQELLLGSGYVGKVYSLASEPNFCVKEIYNEVGYAKENSVSQEAFFLNDLSNFEVAGVRTPYVKETISGGGLTVIVMEELDAVNFEIAARGKAPIPEGFEMNDFFDRLKQYIEAMHTEKGIAHRDLAPRNIMICNKTGRPLVIDFGKSEYLADSKNSDMAIGKDWGGIEASQSLMRKFIEANNM